MADKSGKTDMERIGLFQEMTYVTIGDRYKSSAQFSFNESASHGKQMLPGGSKQLSALQPGYFDVKYNRIFEGEGYSDPLSMRRRFRMQQKKKDIGKPFLPANGPKMACGLGNYYGTIGGPVAAFSPLRRSFKPSGAPPRNIFTSPGKRGTGYGYANVSLGPYPVHSVDPYMKAKEQMQVFVNNHKKLLKGGAFKPNAYPEKYFDSNPYRIDKALPPTRKVKERLHVDLKPFKPSSPGKMMGGGKFGTFDPYPQHPSDVYFDKIQRAKDIKNNSGKLYIPHPGPKTRPVNSIVTQNILRSMNIQNYRTMTVA